MLTVDVYTMQRTHIAPIPLHCQEELSHCIQELLSLHVDVNKVNLVRKYLNTDLPQWTGGRALHHGPATDDILVGH